MCGYRLNDVSGRGVHPLCADESELWWSAEDLAEAGRMIARRAGAASPPPNWVVTAVCGLIDGEPDNRDDVEAVVSAILRDAAADPLWRTTANGWRPDLTTKNPSVVGSTVRSLVAARLLRPTGRYVRCTDVASGNGGKPQPVYEVDLSVLEAAVPSQRPAAEQPPLDQAPNEDSADAAGRVGS
ncbi:hypothetical protein ACQPW3_13360 [Actinosynnema sp. CA-248983]